MYVTYDNLRKNQFKKGSELSRFSNIRIFSRKSSLRRILSSTSFYRKFTSGIFDGFDVATILKIAHSVNFLSRHVTHVIGIIIVDRRIRDTSLRRRGRGGGSVSREAKGAALSGYRRKEYRCTYTHTRKRRRKRERGKKKRGKVP